MKIVIDIPKFVYDMTKAQKKVIDADAEIVGKAIVEGSILPDNATNGDMIKAMFPNIKYEENGNSTTLYFDKKIGTIVTHDFWNAPYKGGGIDGNG